MRRMRRDRRRKRGISYHIVALCQVKLVGTGIKGREEENEDGKNKLREQGHKEEHTKAFEGKLVEWDEFTYDQEI